MTRTSFITLFLRREEEQFLLFSVSSPSPLTLSLQPSLACLLPSSYHGNCPCQVSRSPSIVKPHGCFHLSKTSYSISLQHSSLDYLFFLRLSSFLLPFWALSCHVLHELFFCCPPRSVVLNEGGHFCSIGDTWQCLETFWVVTGWMLLASSG